MKSTVERPAKAAPRLTRRQKILESFISGTRVEAIAKDLGMRPKQVEKTLSEEIKTLAVRPAGQFANVQLTRLERVLGVLSEKIAKGDLRAIEIYLRALDRAERLYGFLKRLGIEYESTAREDRGAAEKVTRLMLTVNPKLFSEKT